MPKTSSPPSVLEPRCPSRLVLERIADKWTALVIQILAGGTMRYAELQRAIGGISQKMLTQTLRSLERDGLVQLRCIRSFHQKWNIRSQDWAER
jgi:DNA-binding HxlR family transcriptional regulator